jgi:hypothetical protein
MDVRSRQDRQIRNATTARGRHYACFAGGHEKLAGRIADGGHTNPVSITNPPVGASLLAIAVCLKK